MRRHALPLSLLALLSTGCWTLPEEVTLTGTLLDERNGGTLGGATMTVSTPLNEPWSEGSTADDGSFSIGVPASSAFFVVFDDADHVPTSFTGIAGSSDVSAEEGTLYMRAPWEIDELRADFSACPRVDEPGPIIEGEVRPYLGVDAAPEELPTITTAWITVYDADDNATSACYLDDDGNSLPDGTRTGNTGRFAVFGAPEGPVSIEVAYDFTPDVALSTWYIALTPTDGIVPMYPAWVEVP